jgi:hypothetical protein
MEGTKEVQRGRERVEIHEARDTAAQALHELRRTHNVDQAELIFVSAPTKNHGGDRAPHGARGHWFGCLPAKTLSQKGLLGRKGTTHTQR